MRLFPKTTLRPSDTFTIPDLDVTPVMNLFIILIPFLISMVVFTHLAVLHLSLPPNIGNGSEKTNEKPRCKLTVVIAEKYLAITHGETMLDSIESIDDVYDIETLSKRLAQHRAEGRLFDEAIVAVRDRIEFEDVVTVMDVCRNCGFVKIGLSNATEDPHTGI